MKHSDVVAGFVVEKYLLRELAPAQLGEFEEHYASCPECIADLRAGMAAARSLRAYWQTAPSPARKPAARRWLRSAYAWAAAALLLLAILGYQSLVAGPRLRRQLAVAHRAQVLPSFSLVSLGMRSSAGLVIRANPEAPLGLYVVAPPQDGVAYYTCRLQTEAGAERLSLHVPVEQAAEATLLLIPAGTFTPGRFVLVMEGHTPGPAGETPGVEVARYRFDFQDQRAPVKAPEGSPPQ
jgi:anti-sigma factor RsiW